MTQTFNKCIYHVYSASINQVQNEMENRKDVMDLCQCYTPCDNTKYSIQYSLSQWPPGL